MENKEQSKSERVHDLKEELNRLEMEILTEERETEREAEESYRTHNNIDVYCSDDYAGLETGKYSFYFGYEYTMCPVKSHKKDCDDNGCDKREWCFVAWINQKEVMRIPASKLYPKQQEEPMFFLLAGIGLFLKKGKKK